MAAYTRYRLDSKGRIDEEHNEADRERQCCDVEKLPEKHHHPRGEEEGPPSSQKPMPYASIIEVG
jgi:hypothetical protein